MSSINNRITSNMRNQNTRSTTPSITNPLSQLSHSNGQKYKQSSVQNNHPNKQKMLLELQIIKNKPQLSISDHNESPTKKISFQDDQMLINNSNHKNMTQQDSQKQSYCMKMGQVCQGNNISKDSSIQQQQQIESKLNIQSNSINSQPVKLIQSIQINLSSQNNLTTQTNSKTQTNLNTQNNLKPQNNRTTQTNLNTQNSLKTQTNLTNQIILTNNTLPSLTQMIRTHITTNNQLLVTNTLMKQSTLKISVQKDFQHIFNNPNNTNRNNNNNPINMNNNNSNNNSNNNNSTTNILCNPILSLPPSQQLLKICEWLQQGQQISGMANLQLKHIPKLLHLIHHKIPQSCIILTQYTQYYTMIMANLERLSKLKWGVMNSTLTEQQKIKLIQLNQLKKIKLFFMEPSVLFNQPYLTFQCDLLVVMDAHLYWDHPKYGTTKNSLQNSTNNYKNQLLNKFISRCHPGRLLILDCTETYKQFYTQLKSTNEADGLNKSCIYTNQTNIQLNVNGVKSTSQLSSNTTQPNSNPLSNNPLTNNPLTRLTKITNITPEYSAPSCWVVLKSTAEDKLKHSLAYISKVTAKKTLIIVPNKNEANALNKQLQLQSLLSINATDYITPQLFSNYNNDSLLHARHRDQAKLHDSLKRISAADIVVSVGCDFLRFINFDLTIFYSFIDTHRFAEWTPNATNKLMLFDENDYYTLRNKTTAELIHTNILCSVVAELIARPTRKDNVASKRCYADCVEQSAFLQIKAQQKVIKANSFARQHQISPKCFDRIVEALEALSIIQVMSRAVYDIEIDETSVSWFRKRFSTYPQTRRKFSILNVSTQLGRTTKAMMDEFSKEGVGFKVVEEALQLKLHGSYQDLDWSGLLTKVNQAIMDQAYNYDKSFDVFKECAYGSIELTRREKTLQRKDRILQGSQYAIPKIQKCIQTSIPPVLQSSNMLSLDPRQVPQTNAQIQFTRKYSDLVATTTSDHFHRFNTLYSEIEESLKAAREELQLDEHETTLLLQGVTRPKLTCLKELPVFGRYRHYKYENLIDVVKHASKDKQSGTKRVKEN